MKPENPLFDDRVMPVQRHLLSAMAISGGLAVVLAIAGFTGGNWLGMKAVGMLFAAAPFAGAASLFFWTSALGIRVAATFVNKSTRRRVLFTLVLELPFAVLCGAFAVYLVVVGLNQLEPVS